MKLNDNAQKACNQIVNLFQSGELPKALSQVFLKTGATPSASWSWNNQIIMILNNTADARGFKQWLEVGRSVKKGSKAFYILAPMSKKFVDEATQEERVFIFGFKTLPVFKIEDTEIVSPELWEKAMKAKTIDYLLSLPLREVAEAWGLDIAAFNGKIGKPLGYYSPGRVIALGVENLSTWCHELIHAADDRNGTLSKKMQTGQNTENEVVAELGGAVLLTMMGMEHEADLGGAWNYIVKYGAGDAIKLCLQLTKRICECIDLIVKEAEKTGILQNVA
jgi:antirestriction protein ArdC